ncbi:UvrB/UvrC motif-containing protein [Patescibacteria group bacterium]|nr:UvrB/UvrC motif-containing protein [Patescibacteria group bacterium]MBU1891130.1 UvrB/UvrC motif-containing protein [Patescibacteria group bacterium]
MYWANFLHFYQPPTQKPYWVKKIANESYRKIVSGLLKNPKARLTLNINAVLVELFKRDGCLDVVYGLKKLSERGQIEFTETAKYHPFLPLMPEKEIIRQIHLNHRTNKRFFGKSYKPVGLFPTEMGYSPKISRIAKKLGYKWIIIDELAHPDNKNMDRRAVYNMKNDPNFFFFFRERDISFRILSAQVGISVFSSKMLVEVLGERVNTNNYLVTAMDGETFGHHRPGLENLLFDLYKVPQIKSVTLSEIPELFPDRSSVTPLSSSWALMQRDIEHNTPFSRWNDKDNEIHQAQWTLTNTAIRLVNQLNPKLKSYKKIRHALDRSLHSDQYWWASAMPWWSIEMIEAGAKELRDVICMVPGQSQSTYQKAKDLYQSIIHSAFDWQRSGKVENLARLADEDVTQRISIEMPYIPIKEFNNIVANLSRQMLQAAKNKEYERAAQIRDRVIELEEKKKLLTTKHGIQRKKGSSSRR